MHDWLSKLAQTQNQLHYLFFQNRSRLSSKMSQYQNKKSAQKNFVGSFITYAYGSSLKTYKQTHPQLCHGTCPYTIPFLSKTCILQGVPCFSPKYAPFCVKDILTVYGKHGIQDQKVCIGCAFGRGLHSLPQRHEIIQPHAQVSILNRKKVVFYATLCGTKVEAIAI